jgi:hypothetical protein
MFSRIIVVMNESGGYSDSITSLSDEDESTLKKAVDELNVRIKK